MNDAPIFHKKPNGLTVVSLPSGFWPNSIKIAKELVGEIDILKYDDDGWIHIEVFNGEARYEIVHSYESKSQYKCVLIDGWYEE